MMKESVTIPCIFLLAVFLAACTKQNDQNIILPERTDVIKIVFITEDNQKSVVEKGKIDDLMFGLSTIEHKAFDSYQDTPQADDYVEIVFETPRGKSSKVYIFKLGNDFFIEQPYTGIFAIDENLYDSILASCSEETITP